jgi:hypothetical protein
MKVYMLKTPSGQLPVGIFSSYEEACDLAQSMFRLCSVTEAKCIEEFELDPMAEMREKGIYPWAVRINVITKEAEVGTLGTLFDEEHVTYTQGQLATAYVFAPNEEEAENKALELWEDYQAGADAIKAVSIFSVSLDENGEITDARKMIAYTQQTDLKDEIKDFYARGRSSVDVRVLADSIDEAIIKARELYDNWIDSQLDMMDFTEEV